mgnify:FL=1
MIHICVNSCVGQEDAVVVLLEVVEAAVVEDVGEDKVEGLPLVQTHSMLN